VAQQTCCPGLRESNSLSANDKFEEEMRYILALLCLAFLVGCTPKSKEMPQQDATLFMSAIAGDIEGMRKALQSGANVDCRQRGLCGTGFMTDATPLYAAVLHKHKPAVAFLLKHDADSSIPNHRGETPLALAERLNLEGIITILNEDES
jgi:hypothetical protein